MQNITVTMTAMDKKGAIVTKYEMHKFAKRETIGKNVEKEITICYKAFPNAVRVIVDIAFP